MDFTEIKEYHYILEPTRLIPVDSHSPQLTDSPVIQKKTTNILTMHQLKVNQCSNSNESEIAFVKSIIEQIINQSFTQINQLTRNALDDLTRKTITSRLTNSIKSQNANHQNATNDSALIEEPALDDPKRIQIKVYGLTRCICSIPLIIL